MSTQKLRTLVHFPCEWQRWKRRQLQAQSVTFIRRHCERGVSGPKRSVINIYFSVLIVHIRNGLLFELWFLLILFDFYLFFFAIFKCDKSVLCALAHRTWSECRPIIYGAIYVCLVLRCSVKFFFGNSIFSNLHGTFVRVHEFHSCHLVWFAIKFALFVKIQSILWLMCICVFYAWIYSKAQNNE